MNELAYRSSLLTGSGGEFWSVTVGLLIYRQSEMLLMLILDARNVTLTTMNVRLYSLGM